MFIEQNTKCSPFDGLVFDFGDLVLNEQEYLVQDFVLYGLVTLEYGWILPDLSHEVIKPHKSKGV